MSKYLLTGDWHFQRGIKTTILVNYLQYIQNYCTENDITKIIIMGDVFDKSSSIKNDAFIPLFRQLYEMKNNGIEFTIIVGNHDVFNKNNDSIIEVFSPIAHVIKNYYIDDDLDAVFVSYTKEPEVFTQIPAKKYLFTHVPIVDFSFDNAYHATEKHAFRPELFEDYDTVFSGHFHRFQHNKNIVYVGSPFQMNFGEIGQKKGFIVLDDYINEWEFIPYDGPEYMKFYVSEFNDVDVENKFVGVVVDTKIQNYVKLKRLLYDRGAIDVQPFFEKAEEDIDEIEETEYTAIVDIVREYLQNVEKDGISNDTLLQKFEMVLHEI